MLILLQEILEAWYMDHYDKPYPTNGEIEKLATETQLSVPNTRRWFSLRRIDTYKDIAYENRCNQSNYDTLENGRCARLGIKTSNRI